MSDERDRSDAAGDDGDTGESAGTVGPGGHSRTTLATRPATGPQRPTGKRSRQRAATAEEDGGVDVVSTATELTESGSDAATEGDKKGKKAQKAGKTGKTRKKAEGPSRNPVVYVYEYLKQVVAELRKVIWPNQKQMITYTSVVLAFLMFMVALIAGSDYGFAKLVLSIFGDR